MSVTLRFQTGLILYMPTPMSSIQPPLYNDACRLCVLLELGIVEIRLDRVPVTLKENDWSRRDRSLPNCHNRHALRLPFWINASKDHHFPCNTLIDFSEKSNYRGTIRSRMNGTRIITKEWRNKSRLGLFAFVRMHSLPPQGKKTGRLCAARQTRMTPRMNQRKQMITRRKRTGKRRNKELEWLLFLDGFF